MASPKGSATRPTSARVRQTLFDVLAVMLPRARVLDVFAGSGAVGLEAVSRGASRAVLIDSSQEAVQAMRRSVQALGSLGGRIQVLRQEARLALPALAARGERFELVYVDPPYNAALYEGVLAAVDHTELLAEGGVLVAEHFHKRVLPERIGRLRCYRQIRIGDHRLSFYARESEP